MTQAKGIILGAIMGTLAGSIVIMLSPKIIVMHPKGKKILDAFHEQTDNLAHKVKDATGFVLEKAYPKPQPRNGLFVAGALLGMVAGAGISAFLTTKNGKNLKKEFGKAYQGISDKTQDFLDDYMHNNTEKHHRKKQTITK